jgi:hypothetical protein
MARGRRPSLGPKRDRDALFETRWVHVFEEDTPEGEVYHPETDDVPLSRRPRRRLSFSPDGTARILVPGPDDRFVETPGRWEEEGGPAVVTRGAERARTVIRIRDRTPTRLVISKER